MNANTYKGRESGNGTAQDIDTNTAFNKDFGTTAGTVLEGSNDALYAKLASANTFTGTNTFSNGILVDKSLRILNDAFIDPTGITTDTTILNMWTE